MLLEPSEIIYEGLSNIFLKSGQYFNIFKANSYDELENLVDKEAPDSVIINPSQIQNREKEFSLLKKNSPNTSWVALVYNFFDQQVLSSFDTSIHITDQPGKIVDIVTRLSDSTVQNVDDDDHEQLSEREIEVLKLIVAGLSNKEIAEKLFISIHTVVSHRKNISQKTGIKSQAGLTIYAISNKIIQIEDYIP